MLFTTQRNTAKHLSHKNIGSASTTCMHEKHSGAMEQQKQQIRTKRSRKQLTSCRAKVTLAPTDKSRVVTSCPHILQTCVYKKNCVLYCTYNKTRTKPDASKRQRHHQKGSVIQRTYVAFSTFSSSSSTYFSSSHHLNKNPPMTKHPPDTDSRSSCS